MCVPCLAAAAACKAPTCAGKSRPLDRNLAPKSGAIAQDDVLIGSFLSMLLLIVTTIKNDLTNGGSTAH